MYCSHACNGLLPPLASVAALNCLSTRVVRKWAGCSEFGATPGKQEASWLRCEFFVELEQGVICSPPSPRLFASCCICIQPSSTPHLLSCFLICFFPFCISEHVARSKNLLLLFLQLGEFACDSSCHDGLGTVPLPPWLEVFLARFPIFWVNVCMLLPLHFFLALSCKPAVVGADDKVSTRVCVCVLRLGCGGFSPCFFFVLLL